MTPEQIAAALKHADEVSDDIAAGKRISVMATETLRNDTRKLAAALEAERAKVARLVEASRNLAAWCNVTLYTRHQDETLGSRLKAVDAALTEIKETTDE